MSLALYLQIPNKAQALLGIVVEVNLKSECLPQDILDESDEGVIERLQLREAGLAQNQFLLSTTFTNASPRAKRRQFSTSRSRRRSSR